MGNSTTARAKLASGAAALGVEVDDASQRALMAYLTLLKRWNKVYNLTAVKGDANIMNRHLLDSLSVVPYLHGNRIIDIGSGAGLPGIPVALACPDLKVTLLDSNAKRCRFLRQAQAELKLKNVTIVQQRAEDYQPDEKFDSLLSRAFSNLQDFVAGASRLLAADGRLIAMKGLWPGNESSELPGLFVIESLVKLMIPGLSEQRHLVICKRNDPGEHMGASTKS